MTLSNPTLRPESMSEASDAHRAAEDVYRMVRDSAGPMIREAVRNHSSDVLMMEDVQAIFKRVNRIRNLTDRIHKELANPLKRED